MAIRGDLALSTFEGRLRLAAEPTSGLGDVELSEVTAPGTPAINKLRLYAKDQSAVSALFYKNDAGTEINLSGGITGSGAANQLAIWSAASVLTGDTDLTFLTDTLTATKISVPTSISLTGTGTINVAAMTQGSVPFFGAAGLLSQDNASLFFDDTNNDLIIGATSNPHSTANARGLSVVRSGGVQANLNLFSFGNTGLIRAVAGYTARGTPALPTATQSGDGIVYALAGHTGSAYVAPARIGLVAAENWSGTNQGSYITFDTTALAATTITERFRVGPSGQWGIGGATYGSAAQYFRSAGSAAAPTWATVAASEIGSGAALTGANDTNVTLTLGGTPTTALLAAASLTLGWTGTLGVARGGTNLASYAVGDVLYASGATTLAGLADVAAGSYLRSGGVSTAPLWSTLIVPNAATVNQVVHATATNTYGGSANLTFSGSNLIVTGTQQVSRLGIGKAAHTINLLDAEGTGDAQVRMINTSTTGVFVFTGVGGADYRMSDSTATTGRRTFDWIVNGENMRVRLLSDDGTSMLTDNMLKVAWNGVVTIGNLAGTGSRTVVADANGVLSAP